MIERIIDCISHPRYLGKYYKDKAITIVLMFFLFFVLYAVTFGVRSFTEAPFNDNSYNTIASSVVLKKNINASYENHTLSGAAFLVEDDEFTLSYKSSVNMNNLRLNIVLGEEKANIYYGSYFIATKDYASIKSNGFTMQNIISGNATDLYNFKIFIADILASTNLFFQSYAFLEGLVTTIVYYFIIVLCLYIFAGLINPTIDKNVRFKLCIYDALSFFVGAFFASLFNQGWIIYLSFIIPVIYSSITFRHIIKIVIKK